MSAATGTVIFEHGGELAADIDVDAEAGELRRQYRIAGMEAEAQCGKTEGFDRRIRDFLWRAPSAEGVAVLKAVARVTCACGMGVKSASRHSERLDCEEQSEVGLTRWSGAHEDELDDVRPSRRLLYGTGRDRVLPERPYARNVMLPEASRPCQTAPPG